MAKFCYLMFMIFVSISCSNEQDDSETESTLISNSINLIFKNEKGDDLLNDSVNGYLSDPQLYYLIDGERIKAQEYDPQIGSETGTLLITESDPYELRCFLYDGTENVLSDSAGIQTGINTNYLELNGEITDTITIQWEFIEKNGTFSIMKVWINSELQTETGDTFSIIK